MPAHGSEAAQLGSEVPSNQMEEVLCQAQTAHPSSLQAASSPAMPAWDESVAAGRVPGEVINERTQAQRGGERQRQRVTLEGRGHNLKGGM